MAIALISQTLSHTTVTGGGTPAGSYSEYQYNNAGSFGAVTNTGPVPLTGWTPVNFSTWANVNNFAGNNIELSIGNNSTLNNVLYCLHKKGIFYSNYEI